MIYGLGVGDGVGLGSGYKDRDGVGVGGGHLGSSGYEEVAHKDSMDLCVCGVHKHRGAGSLFRVNRPPNGYIWAAAYI